MENENIEDEYNTLTEMQKRFIDYYIERLKKNHKDDYIDAIRYAVQSKKGEKA